MSTLTEKFISALQALVSGGQSLPKTHPKLRAMLEDPKAKKELEEILRTGKPREFEFLGEKQRLSISDGSASEWTSNEVNKRMSSEENEKDLSRRIR